jgi:hypothetical protein
MRRRVTKVATASNGEIWGVVSVAAKRGSGRPDDNTDIVASRGPRVRSQGVVM